MKKPPFYPYLFLILFFVIAFNLPTSWSEALRSKMVQKVSPTWKKGRDLTASFKNSSKKSEFRLVEDEKEHLALENIQLKKQNENLRKRLFSEEKIHSLLQKSTSLSAFEKKLPHLQSFYKRRNAEIERLLGQELTSFTAEVIYRDPATWSDILWINVGEETNRKLNYNLISKNSPVLFGKYVIGVVESVGKSQSRVRLITSSSLTPAVRAVRGSIQNREMLELIDSIMLHLNFSQEKLFTKEKVKHFYEVLGEIQEGLYKERGESYLAKGELSGTSAPLWRSRCNHLKGVGFNYDFSDDEGPARELTSGSELNELSRKESFDLIAVGDILISSGLDGVFPGGLPIAVVTAVDPLEEGAFSYTIDARLLAGDLDEIDHVRVLPPLFSSKEQDEKNLN